MRLHGLIGLSAAGKDHTLKNVLEPIGFRCVKSYTTRPRRRGEYRDASHIFVSYEEFDRMERGDFLRAIRSYEVYGNQIWRYGYHVHDLYSNNDKRVAILDADGARELIEPTEAIFVLAPYATRKSRAISRGDDPREFNRRELADRASFAELYREWKDKATIFGYDPDL